MWTPAADDDVLTEEMKKGMNKRNQGRQGKGGKMIGENKGCTPSGHEQALLSVLSGKPTRGKKKPSTEKKRAVLNRS